MTVLTVTPNPALDVTYRVQHLTPYATNRVTAVTHRAGGKGVNVARVLHALGVPVVAAGLAGGPAGSRIRELLAEGDIGAAFSATDAETRRTVAVVDGVDATLFNEPGPSVFGGEWAAFVDRYADLVEQASCVVLAGSLPPGVPVDGYAGLVATARSNGVPVVLDTAGDALRAGIDAGPDVVKPNLTELSVSGRATGQPDTDKVRDAARNMRVAGAGAVVVSRGPYGLLTETRAGTFAARTQAPTTGNPTGAGDAVVAAIARGLVTGTAWPELLRDAAALGAATVHAPVAGEFDADAYARYLRTVTVEELP